MKKLNAPRQQILELGNFLKKTYIHRQKFYFIIRLVPQRLAEMATAAKVISDSSKIYEKKEER